LFIYISVFFLAGPYLSSSTLLYLQLFTPPKSNTSTLSHIYTLTIKRENRGIKTGQYSSNLIYREIKGFEKIGE